MEDINEKANYCLNCKMKPCSLKGVPITKQYTRFYTSSKK